MEKMELEITSVVYIDVDEIIQTMRNGLTLDEAIDDYVSGLDDCDFYVIGSEEIKQIKNYIIKNMG